MAKESEPTNADFDMVARSLLAKKGVKEITPKASEIQVLAPKSAGMEITSEEPELDLGIEAERDVGGIGMGVLKDGTPYLNQRGLAKLCGVQNAHIGTISSQWNEGDQKPRIKAIKAIIEKMGLHASQAHIETIHNGVVHYCYPVEVCLAVLEYYAFDAGTNCQPEARDNFRLLAGTKLKELIYAQVGYDPAGKQSDKFKKWHDRIALNYQGAPKGFFHVFNEAHTVIYELIMAGAPVDEKFVVDISIGQHWSKFWLANDMNKTYGRRRKYNHDYPDDHPQSAANPHPSWCYPLASLGDYRQWLQDEYIEGGKFKNYLEGKVKRKQLPPSIAQLAIKAMDQKALPAS